MKPLVSRLAGHTLCFLCLFVTLSAITVSAQSLPEWYRVYTFDESTIDMNTRVVTAISEDIIRVRFRWRFNEPQSLSGAPEMRYQSQLEVMEFKCSAKRYRPYHVTFYDSVGNMVRINDSPGNWQAVGGMIEKLFVPGCDLFKKKTSPNRVDEEKLKLEKVALFAHDFAQHLETTKDFNLLIERYFVPHYLDGYLHDSETNWFVNLNPNTAAMLSRQELHRFYVALMNAGYLSTLYLVGQLPSDGEDPTTVQKVLPPDVMQLIASHPYTTQYKVREAGFLAENVDSVERLRTYTDLLERISSLMRQHVNTVKSVESEQWRDMLEEWDLYNPKARVCANNCLGLPNGTRIFEVNVPVFHLQVAEVDGKLKVISAISRF